MTSNEIRERFLTFFKKRGHTVVPSSSLLSEDPSVLLTTAGMQQFKPYFTGEADPIKDFGSKNTTSVQKSFRTSDIDEVGDESHLTFFEMLGNFSFGGYFKEEAIRYAYEFITKDMGLAIDCVSVFEGDPSTNSGQVVPADTESEKIWGSVGSNIEVRRANRKENFWGPTGEEGPCGPTTEIYIKNSAGQSIEVWNIVFNEYYCHKDKSLTKLETPGVDTGMGLERLAMVAQQTPTVFETDLFQPIMNAVIEIIGNKPVDSVRVVADHLRASVFLVADGVIPSNIGSGYILRRLIRRAMVKHFKFIGSGLDPKFYIRPAQEGIKLYSDIKQYKILKNKEQDILRVIDEEATKFSETIERGMRKLEKLQKTKLGTVQAFDLYQSYGFPLELTEELTSTHIDRREFEQVLNEHREVSRAGAKTFKGGLADTKPETIRLHTAHHLLLAALQKVLGPHAKQRGSNITSERLRIDFSHPEKLTKEEIKKVEDLVNQKIQEGLDVVCKEMSREEAIKLGAEMEFGTKYGDVVSVYFIQDKDGNIFSKEFCGGPHVKNTREIGRFRIIKEEAVSAGVRRIRGKLDQAHY